MKVAAESWAHQKLLKFYFLVTHYKNSFAILSINIERRRVLCMTTLFAFHYLHTITLCIEIIFISSAVAVILEDDKKDYHNEQQNAQDENGQPLSSVVVRQMENLSHLPHCRIELRVCHVELVPEVVKHPKTNRQFL